MRLVSALLHYYGHFDRRIISLFRRYGISLTFPSILLVIALILTVLIPGISLAQHFVTMCVTVFLIVLLEAGSYIPITNRALAFDFEDRERFRVSSSFYLAASRLLLLFLFLCFFIFFFIFFFFFFIFFFILFFIYFFFFFFFFPLNFPPFAVLIRNVISTLNSRSRIFLRLVYFQLSPYAVLIRNVISTLNSRSRIFLRLIYFQLSNFITFSGNVISSSIFQLYLLISTIQTWLGRFLVNRHSSSSPSNNIDWSHLPPDLACEIVNRMTTFKDYIAATGVSQVWRLARSSISRRAQLPLPALMLSEPLLTDMRTLFSLYDYSRHRLQLSEVHGKRIWGSQRGWVATLGSHYGTQLVHLMTGKRINLPQIQRLAPQEEWFCLVHKFTLLKDPTDESTFHVSAIFGPMNSLAFTRVRVEEGPALNRIGEGEWVVVGNPENLKFKDVEHFNGQIYALCDNGKLVRFEADAPLADMVQVIADHPQDAGAHRKVYLVESLGYLYGVHRIGCLIPSQRRFQTISFVVYKFNFNASAWEEVTHLEGQAFFVGDGNSFSWRFPTSTIPSRSNSIYFTWLFRTSTIPSRSNCIYFTDDWWDWQMDPRIQIIQAFGGHDVGVFDMARRVVQPLAFGIGKDEPCFYSRPIWVTRSHKLI